MAKRVSQRKLSPLIYAASESDADQLYFGRVFVPDAFLSFGVGRKKYAVVSALEFARVKRDSAFDEVLSLEEWLEKARKRYRNKDAGMVEVVRLVAREFGIEGFRIGENFPAGLALKLVAAKVKVEVADGSLFPEREIKSDEEAKAIREGNAASAAGIRAAEKILRAATIKRNGKIYYEGKVLTSERLKTVIEIACLEKGAISSSTIVAGGDQACDPHCTGSGPLRAGELIVIDVFPRVTRTGYYGDMTRTFLKGRASVEQKRLVATVKQGQQLALDSIKAGVSGPTVHHAVEDFFVKSGYVTQKKNGVHEGFFHGTGHGLGLEIHEAPRVSRKGPRLKAGMVTTVEPGLYYPGLGGCRIEDVVRVTREGYEKLSNYPYRWEIA